MQRCFYCGDPFEPPADPEHILPAAISAELTTGRVCRPCNQRAGKEVDTPWLRHPLVHDARQHYAVPDRRGRPARPEERRIVLDDDAPAIVTIDGNDIQLRRLPHTTRNGDNITLIGYDDAATEEKLQRMRRDNPGREVSLVEQTTRTFDDDFQMTFTWTVQMNTWPRFAAKVALGIASLVVDDDWLDSSEAQSLQEILWDGPIPAGQAEESGAGVAWSAMPFQLVPGTHPLVPPEHLIMFEPSPSDPAKQWLVCVTFGELLYRVPLTLDWSPSGAQSWWFDETTKKGRQLPAVLQMYVLASRFDVGPAGDAGGV